MPLTQKALVVEAIGKPVVLVSDHPIPEPGPHQVQIKVTVAGINPHDRKARDTGIFISANLPAVLTNDVVGTVSKIGEQVEGIALGDRVVSQSGLAPGCTQNGLQEYAVADTGAFAKIPACITDDEAATLPCNVVAPLVALYSALKIPAPWSPGASTFDYANTKLLIVGGGSNSGRFGVQLAALAGIGQVVVVGGDVAELTGFGATHVVDRHASYDVVLGRIRDVVGDELIYAFDAVNPPDGQVLALNALSSRKKGALARLLPDKPVDQSKVEGKEAGYDVLNVFGVSQAHPDLAKEFWKRLPGYLETGKIVPLQYVVKQGLEASHVNEVLDRYRDGVAVTKTHIDL